MKTEKKTYTKSGEKGFTLIEALVALAIFSIGILGVATMQIIAMNSNTLARLQTEATALAVNKMEVLHRLPYSDDDLDKGSYEEVDGAYRVAWGVQDGPVNETKMVQVIVTPKNRKGRPVVVNFIKSER